MVQNYGTTQQVTVVDFQGNPIDIGSGSNSTPDSATVAKQDEAIALLNKLTQQLDFANGKGTPHPAINATATITSGDIAPANSDRSLIYLHNHSDTNTLIVNFGATASATSAIYRVQPEQTLIEKGAIVQLRISAVASTGTINYSYLEFSL